MSTSNRKEIQNLGKYVEDHTISQFSNKYIESTAFASLQASEEEFTKTLDLLSNEINRIDKYSLKAMSRVWKLLCETRHSIVDALRTRDNESHAQLFSSLKNISEEIVAIEDFCRTHRLVFGELLKYYEPRMPNALRELLSRKCKDSSFGRVKLSNFLIPMSECYSNLRKLEAGEGVSRPNSVAPSGKDTKEYDSLRPVSVAISTPATSNDCTTEQDPVATTHTDKLPENLVGAAAVAAGEAPTSLRKETKAVEKGWEPPSSFKRKTNKYWVRNRDVLRLCMKIIEHLPILVFGMSQGLPEDLWTSKFTDLQNREASMQYAGQITSVYLDSPEEFKYYNGRLLRQEGALLFRLRWYKSLTCPDRIFIERKTHHEGWGQEDSIKERLSIPTNKLNAFMQGTYVPTESSFKSSDKDIPAQIELAKDIQRQILSDKNPMVPASRTAYERTAFQLSTSNDVRISLDGNLWLSDEMGRTDSFEDAVVNRLNHASGRSILFPYGVLEIKLAGDAPSWIDALLTDFQSSAVQVYKFSKYLSSIAIFHNRRIANLPHWFTDEGTLIDAFAVGGQALAIAEDEAFPDEKSRINRYTLFRVGSGDTLNTGVGTEFTDGYSVEMHSLDSSSYDSSHEINKATFRPMRVFAGAKGDSYTTEEKRWNLRQLFQREPPPLPSPPPSPTSKNSKNSKKQNDLIIFPSTLSFRAAMDGGKGDDEEGKSDYERVAEHSTAKGPMKILKQKKLSAGMRFMRRPVTNSKIGVQPEKKPSPMVPARIEPKTFFANERTFIQWLTTAVLLTTLSLALLNYNTRAAYAAGLAIFPIAIFFILYALGTFMWRLRALQQKKNMEYHDTVGPILLVVGLMAAIVLTLIFVELDRRGVWDTSNNQDPALRVNNARNFQIYPKVDDDGLCKLLLDTPDFPSFSQSSTALVSEAEDKIFITSKQTVYEYAFSDASLTKLSTLTNTDLEGIALGGDTSMLYVSSEDPENELIEILRSDGTEQRRWRMDHSFFSSTSVLEGAAYDSVRDLYWLTSPSSIYGVILGACAVGDDKCDVKIVNSIDMETYVTDRENKIDILSNPFKVGDLYYHSSSDYLYILLDNLNVVKIADLETGTIIATHALPGLTDQWEGLSVSADETKMWLSLNYPPQLWEFSFDPDIGFSSCAKATKNYR